MESNLARFLQTFMQNRFHSTAKRLKRWRQWQTWDPSVVTKPSAMGSDEATCFPEIAWPSRDTRRPNHCPPGHCKAAVLAQCTGCTLVPSLLGRKGGRGATMPICVCDKKKTIRFLPSHCFREVFLQNSEVDSYNIAGSYSRQRFHFQTYPGLTTQQNNSKQRELSFYFFSPQRKKGLFATLWRLPVVKVCADLTASWPEMFLCSSAIIIPKNRSLYSVVCHCMTWWITILRTPRYAAPGNTSLGVSEEAHCCSFGFVFSSCTSGAALTDVLQHSMVMSHIYPAVMFLDAMW